jgi:hypothetical protein
MNGAQGGCARCQNAMKDLKLNGTKASGKTAGLHHKYAGTYAVLAKSQVEQHNKAGAYVKPKVKKEDKLKPQHTMTKPQLLQVIKELKQEKEDQEDQFFFLLSMRPCVCFGGGVFV